MTQRVVNYTYGTGNPVLPDGSIDVRDGIDNLQSFDIFMNADEGTYNQRDGGIVPTVAGAIRSTGFKPGTGDFTTGFTVMPGERDIAWKNPSPPGDNNFYSWDGPIPPTGKFVPAGSTPETTGGVIAGAWRPRTDETLRKELGGEGGVALVGNAADKRGESFSGQVTAKGLKSLTKYGNTIIGDNPMGSPGDDWPLPDGLRDAVNISRKLVNEPTNCHAFSDKTIINGASDYGGYGAYDSTLILMGGHEQNHAHSFQDRIQYIGTNKLDFTCGLFSSPSHGGSGIIGKRNGVYINDIALTGSGTVGEQSGIFIEHLQAAASNVAINVRQLSGYGYYAPFAGKMYQQGVAGFGTDPASLSFAINWKGVGDTTSAIGFATTDNNGMSLGATQDTKIQFVSGGAVRLNIQKKTVSNGAINPGDDNITPLGLSGFRWSVVYAGTGVINTSDEREKTFITINDAEVSVAKELKSMIRKFKFNDAVKAKGDGARIHFGVGAQSVGAVFTKYGLDPHRYALFCFDEWEDSYISGQNTILEPAMGGLTKPEFTEVIETPAGNRYGIRYDELLAFIISAM